MYWAQQPFFGDFIARYKERKSRVKIFIRAAYMKGELAVERRRGVSICFR